MRAIGIVLAGGNSKRMRELSNKRAVAALSLIHILFWSAFSVLLLSYVLWDSRYRYCMERGAAPELFAAVYGIALLTVFLCMTVYRALPHLQICLLYTSRCV